MPRLTPTSRSNGTDTEVEGGTEAGAPKKRKRFRWGCFFVLNMLTAAIVLLLLLLFWPVDESVVVEDEPVSRAVVQGGARIKATNLEDIGSPNFSGPGNDVFTQILIEADVTNTTQKEQLLDTSLLQFRDTHRKAYAAHLPLTLKWMRKNGMENPWDVPIRPGQTKKVAVVFVVFDPPKERRLYVRRGFDWGSQEYFRVPLPPDRSRRTVTEDAATVAIPNEVRDVGDNVNLRDKVDVE